MHEREVLKKWKAKSGFRARYRRLVEAYLELEERGAAEAICKEIGKFGECVVGCITWLSPHVDDIR